MVTIVQVKYLSLVTLSPVTCATVSHRQKPRQNRLRLFIGNSSSFELSQGLISPDVPARGHSVMGEFLATRKAAPLPPNRATILLVEDDRAVRYLFSQVLHNHGYFVIAAEDGATGLDIARARIHTLDAVITDSRMPGLEGRELVTQIRSLRSDIPILVVSGGVETSHDAAASDPATRYFAKPVSPERLLVELCRSLRNASR